MSSTAPIDITEPSSRKKNQDLSTSQESDDTTTEPIDINKANQEDEEYETLSASQSSENTFYSFESERTQYHDCVEAQEAMSEEHGSSFGDGQEDIEFDAWLEEAEEDYGDIDEGIDMEFLDDEGIHMDYDEDEWANLDLDNEDRMPGNLDNEPHTHPDEDVHLPLNNIQQDLAHLTTMALSAQMARFGDAPMLTPVETNDSLVSFFDLDAEVVREEEVGERRVGKVFCGRHGFSCRVCNRK